MMWIRTLSPSECTEVLASHHVARLACAKDGRPYVVPIYYAYADKALHAFSIPGKKIDWMRANPLVSMLVESQAHGRQWKSVIADGRYEALPERIARRCCTVFGAPRCRRYAGKAAQQRVEGINSNLRTRC